jgi:hypothetical protein
MTPTLDFAWLVRLSSPKAKMTSKTTTVIKGVTRRGVASLGIDRQEEGIYGCHPKIFLHSHWARRFTFRSWLSALNCSMAITLRLNAHVFLRRENSITRPNSPSYHLITLQAEKCVGHHPLPPVTKTTLQTRMVSQGSLEVKGVNAFAKESDFNKSKP